MSLTGFLGSSEAQFLETPMGIVSIDEFRYGTAHLLDVAEHPAVDGLLLEGAVEALGNTVGLRLCDEREARREAAEAARGWRIPGSAGGQNVKPKAS